MAQTTQNEPTQDAIDAVSLGMIRLAKKATDKKQGELRATYTTVSLRQLNTDAAKTAIKLFDGGNEAIDKFYKDFEKASRYLRLLGKELTPTQYEMFGEKRGPAPEDERAGTEGRAAGFDIDPEMSEAKCPYEVGSLKGQAWLAAFRQARTERDAVLAMPMPVSDADDSNDEGDED